MSLYFFLLHATLHQRQRCQHSEYFNRKSVSALMEATYILYAYNDSMLHTPGARNKQRR